MDTTSTAFVDNAQRDRVTVAGPDALRYLQSQLAQDIDGLAVGGDTWTLVLDPSGKVDALARVTRTADESFVLDTDPGFGEVLVARLARFKIRVEAEIELDAADGGPAADHEVERVAAGWPRMGAEIVPGETIPATTGLIDLAVSLTKGCYPGQELVERMDSRGADAPRLLRVLDVGPDAEVGDPILDADGTEVGSLTSVAGGTGLGYVKRGSTIGSPPAHAPR
ncbi:MAG: YgfZ/GcvT domain-containing protein [Ilumatobacteraceae bacterium]